ncbi:hypothetical protein FIU83_02130 [Halomonas sp. THAF5a]|nr:hypothetical protein [Halomonas sp. THAF5a]QFU00437.1 hypothetical protein FIU83_02130 [Halomonas sp. THAF5a]
MTPALPATPRTPVDAPRRGHACLGDEAALQGFQGWYGDWFSTGVPVAMS